MRRGSEGIYQALSLSVLQVRPDWEKGKTFTLRGRLDLILTLTGQDFLVPERRISMIQMRLFLKPFWTASGAVVLRYGQGAGRERTQSSIEGCLSQAPHKGQQTDFRETGAQGRAVQEDRGAKWEPWVVWAWSVGGLSDLA